MKHIGFGCLVGFSLFFLSACSNDKVVANTANKNTETEKKPIVVEPEFKYDDLEKIEYIAETKFSRIGRFIDCKAGVTIYATEKSISIIPNAQISQDLVKEKCK